MMPEYVVKIIGKLSPSPTQEYAAFTINRSSFSITVEKDEVVAELSPSIQLEFDKAQELLNDALSPILTVLSAGEGKITTFAITHVVYPTYTTRTLTTWARTIFKIAEASTNDVSHDISQKIQWAAIDSTYRDMLDFYTEAQPAPNPRPIGHKMIERLEKRFGSRKKACLALGLQLRDLNLVMAYPSKYKGDRHADYNVGEVPVHLSSQERHEILTLLKNIIERYERYVCSKTLP